MKVMEVDMEIVDIVDTKCMLQPLINMLNDPKKSIDELDLLDEFPLSQVTFFNFSPRLFIEYMKNMHECFQNRNRDTKVIHYKYEDTSNTKLFDFTDNMSLVDDIIIICYLYHLFVMLTTQQFLNVKAIHDLRTMMEKKYDLEMNIYNSPKSVSTWVRVACSFPSISLWCGWLLSKRNNSNKELPTSDLYFTFRLYPQTFNIRYKILWYYLLSSIIPILKFDLESIRFPIMYLVAGNYKIKQVLDTKNINLPYTYTLLQLTYQGTLALCLSNIFPERLKLKICKKWGIIQKDKKQKQYKYNDYFKNNDENVVETLTQNISNKELHNFLDFIKKQNERVLI